MQGQLRCIGDGKKQMHGGGGGGRAQAHNVRARLAWGQAGPI